MLCFELFGTEQIQVIEILTYRGKDGGSVLFQEMGTKFLITFSVSVIARRKSLPVEGCDSLDQLYEIRSHGECCEILGVFPG